MTHGYHPSMRMLAGLIAFALFATVLPAPARAAAPAPADLVKAELLADVASVKPGQPFHAGVLLKIKPKWHVYWKNPGDSGLPTRVKWNLPPGWKAGELQFPLPDRFDQPGDVVGYGYHDAVMLITTLTPPADLPAGGPVELSADVNWLVCEAICVPGKAKLTLSLPAGDSAPTPANAEAFATWTERMPARGTEAGKLAAIEVKGTNPVQARVRFMRPGKDVQWFVVPPEQSGLENVQTNSDGELSSTVSFSLAPPPASAADVWFLVAYTDQYGKRRGAEFNVMLPPPAGK